MRSLSVVLALGLLPAQTASAAGHWSLASGPRRAALLELFTSEGCSSCPRADRWLSSLRESAGLWRDFVPAGFHVTYWDHLGWPDRLAARDFTRRQSEYAAFWGTESVYTPGVVWAGREWRDWGREPGRLREETGVLRAEGEGARELRIFFRPGAGGSRERWRAHAALLGFELFTVVRAGENAGRKLRHDFAALAYASAPLEGKDGVLAGVLRLPEPSLPAPRRGLAVWVTRGDDPTPVQAAGGYLP